MEHTKESFEKYLGECREANKWGDRPPVEVINCPVCPDRVATLRSLPLEHWIIPHHWKGTQWGYVCANCKGEWTTNESDSVTLASLQHVK